MVIRSLELSGFRNFRLLDMNFDAKTNILYGDNAQGKTNILEAIYLCATTKSHRGTKDKDIVAFGEEEGHIRIFLEKKGDEIRIDMHLRKNGSKGIAIDGQKLKRASQLLGVMNVVFFSPEDLSIIKNGPAERRRFVDMELCQLDPVYLRDLNSYNKIVNQRNRLLKDIGFQPELAGTLDVWDMQLSGYAKRIIRRRAAFAEELGGIIRRVHESLSGGKEQLEVIYEPHVREDEVEGRMERNRERDIRLKQTTTGPHRDDFAFLANGIDIRRFGSQGQQRTAALSLKLSEIELVKRVTKDAPILLLDDVLSELDSSRQNYLLNSIGDIQTIVTCTGLDEFVNNRFEINRIFHVSQGQVSDYSDPGSARP